MRGDGQATRSELGLLNFDLRISQRYVFRFFMKVENLGMASRQGPLCWHYVLGGMFSSDGCEE